VFVSLTLDVRANYDAFFSIGVRGPQKIMRIKMRVPLFLLLVIFGAQTRLFGGDWKLIDLGTLGGSGSFGQAINNLGEVVGMSKLPGDAASHAFFYSGGVMRDIAPFNSGNLLVIQFGLNDIGQAVDGVVVGSMYYPAIYNSHTGNITTLGLFGGNYYNFTGWASGINNSGVVVGTSYLRSGLERAYVYRNGVMTDLGALSGSYSEAVAINNSGMIAGSSYGRAVVWINNSIVDISQGVESYAEAINDSGTVVGRYRHVDHDEAFIWSGGNLQGLGALTPGGTSGAEDINNNGDIVGYSYVGNGTHGFLYQNGVMVDLNSLMPTNSGWVITHAYGVNDSDQILCQGSSGGLSHSFILQVPEPSVSSLLILGSAGVIACRRWNRKGVETIRVRSEQRAFHRVSSAGASDGYGIKMIRGRCL
jgi:probable HAF family extracellular repeat protein